MQTKKVISHIVNWTKEYVSRSNSKGMVIGISGGVDSAVTSTLLANTNLPVLCIEMPIHQDVNQIKRGTNHIKWLKSNFNNVNSIYIDLSSAFDNLIQEISKNSKSNDLTLANTRARLRMTTLYYYAGINNYLVAGTGNKIEDFGVGFFTKYGDGGVDISPIADLTKTEVYQIAKHIDINNEIITAAPTDGLWGEERTDEEQIGANYEELEWAMNFKGDLSKIEGRKKEVLEIFTHLNSVNQHKMRPIPVCLIPKKIK